MSDYRRAREALQNYPHGTAIETWAVERALEKQKENVNYEDRLTMVELKYFRKSHNLLGVSAITGYSIETVRKWNIEILANIDGRLDRPEL